MPCIGRVIHDGAGAFEYIASEFSGAAATAVRSAELGGSAA